MILLAFQAPQQPQRATIEAHVVRPASVAPTPALVASLKMPEGFHLARWADGLANPRVLQVHRGVVYATQRSDENVVMLKDTDGDGIADVQREVARGEDLHGLAFRGDWAYLVGIRKLWRAPVKPDGTFGPKQELMRDLPDAGQHPNRTVEVGPDGRIYVSCGSTANDAVEHNPYNATMVVCDPDGKNRAIYASGLRNTIGFDWQPGTNALYGWDQGIDWLGDDAQREEVNLMQKGRRYGWPFVYEAGKVDQNAHLAGEKGFTIEGWLAQSTSPALTYTAHAAGMQMRFYRSNLFPGEYRGDAFASMHGSWNRQPPSGYEVVRVHFENGAPKSVEPFLTGFLRDPQGRPSQFGRPCGLAAMPDGSLLIGDDEHGAIYRLIYGRADDRALALQALDTTKLSSDLVRAPKTVKVVLGAFGEPNSEYAKGGGTSPALSIGALPKGTKTLALTMEDPDAGIKPLVHWLMADLETDPKESKGSIPEDLRAGDRPMLGSPKPSRVAYFYLGGVQGGNSHGKVGYSGPKPPIGDKPHRYVFTIYALDRTLGVMAGFNRMALLKAMRGHVLGQGSAVGMYAKRP